MSRPFRFLLSGAMLVSALALTSCVGTIYDQTYTNHRNYFKPPKEKATAGADTLLGSGEKKADLDSLLGGAPGAAPGGLPPAGDVPGMPGAGGLPAPGGLPDPNAAPAIPGVPGAPAAPAIPGVPPAPGAPPPPGTPPPPPPN